MSHWHQDQSQVHIFSLVFSMWTTDSSMTWYVGKIPSKTSQLQFANFKYVIAQYMAKAPCTRHNMMKWALYDNLVHFPKSSYITWLIINFVKGQSVTYIYLINKSIIWWSFIVKCQSVVIKIFKSMYDYHISIHKII